MANQRPGDRSPIHLSSRESSLSHHPPYKASECLMGSWRPSLASHWSRRPTLASHWSTQASRPGLGAFSPRHDLFHRRQDHHKLNTLSVNGSLSVIVSVGFWMLRCGLRHSNINSKKDLHFEILNFAFLDLEHSLFK